MPSLNVTTTTNLGFVLFFKIMSRQTEIIVVADFCNQLETKSVLCCDIVRNVATFFLMLFWTYVTRMKKFVVIETFLFKLSLKLIMSRHRESMSRHNKFYAPVNLCCNIQKYCRDNVFLFQKHRSLTTLS